MKTRTIISIMVAAVMTSCNLESDNCPKVIQVPFEIPAPSMSDIYDALFAKLNTIFGDIPDEKWDKATWSELFQFGLKRYVRSIRDVIRFTNVLSLKYELLKNETNLLDLIGLTCLQVFEPIIYSKLPHNKEILCGSEQVGWSNSSKNDEEERIKSSVSELLMNDESTSDYEAAKNVLGILFPKIRTAIGLPFSLGRQYSHKVFFIQNNIATSECFDRYFALSLEQDALPTPVINYLIYGSNETDFSTQMLQIYQDGKLIR